MFLEEIQMSGLDQIEHFIVYNLFSIYNSYSSILYNFYETVLNFKNIYALDRVVLICIN